MKHPKRIVGSCSKKAGGFVLTSQKVPRATAQLCQACSNFVFADLRWGGVHSPDGKCWLRGERCMAERPGRQAMVASHHPSITSAAAHAAWARWGRAGRLPGSGGQPRGTLAAVGHLLQPEEAVCGQPLRGGGGCGGGGKRNDPSF